MENITTTNSYEFIAAKMYPPVGNGTVISNVKSQKDWFTAIKSFALLRQATRCLIICPTRNLYSQ